MTEGGGSKGMRPVFTDEQVLAWMDQHAPKLRQEYVSGHRLLRQSLVLGLVVGLAAHVGGYVLASSVPSGPLGLLADLIHALGWSLWTGVVVVVFTQILPEVKRRQIRRTLDAYETLRREAGKSAKT